ncbi:MAG: 30S ribosomal protein S6 [Candidatus Paceibacterota bacterium]
MSETKVPAAEASQADERELVSYEFAFHVLPTVAEGEVASVFDQLKNHITKAKGEIFDEESPKRFDLAYEIIKYLEGKNRKFGSAYFGWVRFRLDPAKLNSLTESLDGTKELLRFLLVKLTKVEEENPFRFHDSIASRKVQVIDDEDVEGETDDEETDEEVNEKEETESVEGKTEEVSEDSK